MNTKKCFLVIVVTIMSISVYGTCFFNKVGKMTDVMLMNVEVLADNENLRPGKYNVYDEVTTYYDGGNPYRKTKSRDCEEGGCYECKEGNYYCYLKADGQWSEWFPA